ncbi:hypothetical protein RJ55_00297 [Drechmeria coniospora]|nr:hypothetical protein RJ55_00297 [Drechmeria coniospora]
MLRPTGRLCGWCLRAQKASSSPVAATTTTTATTPAQPHLHPRQWPRRNPPLRPDALAAASRHRWASPPPQARLVSQSARLYSSAAASAAHHDGSPGSSSPPQRQPRRQAETQSTLYDLFPQTLPDGPPPRGHFPVDTSALRREFLRLQAAHHPDKHPAERKHAAEATSSAINHAYRTLANPLLRAQYLLTLRGVDVAADEALKVDEPDLLALVLDTHEAIEAAVSADDLVPLRDANEARISRSELLLERAFRDDDVDAAKSEAVRLRYWVNLRESLHGWEEEGAPVMLHH